MKSSFTLEKSNEQVNPRAGILSLPNGEVPTPVFMPVGTQATVKGTLPRDLHDVVKCPIILGNTYHLNLRPGVEIVRKAGGLSKFMNWNGPVLTDSGGFQVFSLSKLRKIDDAGVSFRSHIDGSEIFLGPREAIDIQDGLHSDIAMCLDECPPAEATQKEVQSATDRTSLWAQDCLNQWREKKCDLDGRMLFGIVQGGRFEDLRIKSARELIAMNFPGYAIGGVSVGETEEEMLEQVKWATSVLPQEKPRYVMGVGTPPQLLQMIGMGADMFDCVMPSRAARHGMAFIKMVPLIYETRNLRKIHLHWMKAWIVTIVNSPSLTSVILSWRRNPRRCSDSQLRFFVNLMRKHAGRSQDTFSEWSAGWIQNYLSNNEKAGGSPGFF